MNIRLTRRMFTKGFAALMGASALYGCGSGSDGENIYRIDTPGEYDFDKPAEHSDGWISSVCTPNCSSKCRFMGRVKDGVLRGVVPGALPGREEYENCCLRGISIPWKLQSATERVLYPMYRSDRSKFGTMEGFEQISWDRAFTILADKIRAASSPDKVCTFTMTGNASTFANGSHARFLNTINGSMYDVTGGNESMMSDNGASRALTMCFGSTRGGNDTRDYVNSKMLLIFARNIADTHTCEYRYIMDAKEAGCRVICVDQRFSATAYGTEWLPIFPGTDSVFALSMMNYIFANNLHDKNYITTKTCGPMLIDTATGKYVRDGSAASANFAYWDNAANDVKWIARDNAANYEGDPDISDTVRSVTTGGTTYSTCRTAFSYLKEEVMKDMYTPANAAAITGIPAAKTIEIADFYAKNKPCGIRLGQGMQRMNYAYQSMRAVATLAAVCGQIGISGGNASHLGFNAVRTTPSGGVTVATSGPEWSRNKSGAGHTSRRGIDLYNSVDGVDGAHLVNKPEVLIVAVSGLVNQSPDYNRLTKVVLPGIPFVVNQDPFINATSPFCDLLLPTKTMHENWDLYARTPWTFLQQPMFEAPGDPLSDVEIYSGVAEKLGYGDYWRCTTKEYVQERCTSSTLLSAGFTWEKFVETGIWTHTGTKDFSASVWVPNYSTQTRKFEFYNEAIAAAPSTILSEEDKKQKVPAYGKPYEDQNDKTPGSLATKYPLKFTQYHDRQSVHTQNLLSPVLKVVAKEPFIEIHPDDAANRGIRHKDYVRVFNDRGSMTLQAWVTPGVIKGALALPCGWAPKHFKAGHYQELTHCKQNAVENLLGESNFAAYDNLVEVEKVTL